MDELDLRRETKPQLLHKVSSKTAPAIPLVVLMMQTAAPYASCFSVHPLSASKT